MRVVKCIAFQGLKFDGYNDIKQSFFEKCDKSYCYTYKGL